MSKENRFERIDAQIVQIADTIHQTTGPTTDPGRIGREFLDQGQYELAARQFRDALAARPTDVHLNFLRAIALLQGRRPNRHSREMISQIRAHLRAAADLPEARVLHALVIEDAGLRWRRADHPPEDVLDTARHTASDSAELILRHVPAREARVWRVLAQRREGDGSR
ncbi:hypothetical protein FHX44_113953 [Pseudonocardia hierapolitana]|uniref:Tetratricopeptide repeat protein n=1 Tax=Pseudonocardia hierapolitana TaxID=1128676 RepID=A0A561ST38_9PSEU|nr:hypothetical protein [Pseudonocardia hierapolitana]TWF78034.1 hypothetical protein FHX44_113953 [Pseudonocardia hierapolitana]